LRPGHWGFSRTVRTGDEVEFLDSVVADLTARLAETYEHLEEKVRERTVELQKQYTLDRAILEGVSYGIVSVDAQGVITDCNPAAYALLQWTPEEAIGTKWQDILSLQQLGQNFPGGEDPLSLCLKHATDFRSSSTSSLTLLRKDQSILPVNAIITRLVHKGDSLGAVLLFQDATEERKFSYIKSEFISLASHQLRTPLSSIQWYLELMAAEALSRAQTDYVAEMRTALARMTNLIDALLQTSKLEGSKPALNLHLIDIVELLGETARDWRKMKHEKDIQLDTHIPSHPVLLTTDPAFLSIVLQNILDNAMKYSPAGTVIHLSCVLKPDTVDILIRDEGIGIPAVERDRIFEKFFRAKNVRTIDTTGSGLGLYICKIIMESLSGKISFESQEGKGTTFILTVPLGDGKKAEESRKTA
jgi:PAS domain S-box-containing protein